MLDVLEISLVKFLLLTSIIKQFKKKYNYMIKEAIKPLLKYLLISIDFFRNFNIFIF